MSFPSSAVVLRYPESVVMGVAQSAWKQFTRGQHLEEGPCIKALREALRRLQPVVSVPPDAKLQMAFRNFDVHKTGKLDFAAFWQIVIQYHNYHAERNEGKYKEHLENLKQERQQQKPKEAPPSSILPRGGKWDLVSEIVFPAHKEADIGDVSRDYLIKEELGEGSFGKVSVAIHRATGAKRVVKTIQVTNAVQSSLIKQEIELMKKLNHPNILRLHETYHCGYRIALILELCEGGPLYDRLVTHSSEQLNEAQLAIWMQQILSAVCFCHDRGVVHRDIKPENILFVSTAKDSPIKIIDFGLSSTMQRIRDTAAEITPENGESHSGGLLSRMLPKKTQQQRKQRRMQCAGTPHYMAPEMIRGQYDEKCDIFSVGVILYQMLSGRHPFFVAGLDDRETVKHKILYENPSTDTPEFKTVSPEAIQLVKWMLQKDPKKRCSAREALEHIWIARAGRNRNGFSSELTKSVFEGLREWQGQNKLRQAVCLLLAQEMGESEIQELRRKFEAIDLSGDGTITLNELNKCIAHVGVKMREEEIKQVFESLDRSGTKVIYYTEFISALLSRRVRLEEKQLRNVFARLDTRGEGRIAVRELHEALKGARKGSLSDRKSVV